MLSQDYEFLNEAEFKRENIARVMQLYRKLFGKYFGGEFKIFAEEEYKKPGEKGTGIRLMNNLNYQLRFNWKFSDSNALKKKATQDKTKLYISSIDYWEPTNLDFEKPSATITFLIDVNVVQIWKGLAKVIKKGVRGKYTLKDLQADAELLGVNESTAPKGGFAKYALSESPFKNWGQQSQFLKSQGMKDMSVSDFKKLYADDPELAAKADSYVIELGVGKKETNSTGEKLRKAEKELEQKVYSDPEYVFQDIEDLATLVAKGKLKSLIICGQGGIGKTFHITKKLKEVLGEQPGPWYYHSGMKASPVSFYIKTFEERESIIVWDEADSLLLNDDIVMMLKPALDTSGDNTMEYSRGKSMKGMSMDEIKAYSKEVDQSVAAGKILGLMDKKEFVHIPGKFYFEGSMIFISNMPASKIEGAILSRSVFLDVHLCARDIQKRIMSIMHAKYTGKYTDEQLQKFADAMGGFQSAPDEEVVYMTPELARKKKPVTIRSMELAIAMEEAGLQNWARLASLYA